MEHSAEHCVAVVVDPELGDRLVPLASRTRVRIADTPANRAAAEREWAASRDYDRPADAT